jgi:hypothetical protein
MSGKPRVSFFPFDPQTDIGVSPTAEVLLQICNESGDSVVSLDLKCVFALVIQVHLPKPTEETLEFIRELCIGGIFYPGGDAIRSCRLEFDPRVAWCQIESKSVSCRVLGDDAVRLSAELSSVRDLNLSATIFVHGCPPKLLQGSHFLVPTAPGHLSWEARYGVMTNSNQAWHGLVAFQGMVP